MKRTKYISVNRAEYVSGHKIRLTFNDGTVRVVNFGPFLANVSEFYAHESCGQCTPCREGSLWMAQALHRLTHGQGRKQDADYLLKIATNIQGRTICAFGEACAWPVLSFVSKFRDEFEARGAADEPKANSAGSSPELKIAASPNA